VAAAALTLMVAGCATFPDSGPRDWQPKPEGQGELGGPPQVPDPSQVDPGPPQQQDPTGAPRPPGGCVDPDPQVVATCLNPVGAIAVLPDAQTALVGERTTGRVLQVKKGTDPKLVTTVPVDATGGGGLTGLVLSPAYDEDQLVYAYVSTPTDNRVVRLAPGEPAKPVLVGIPHGPVHNGGALSVDSDGSLLVATGDAGGNAADPASLAGKVLRIDTLGQPGKGNPVAGSPVLSSGVSDPGGICSDRVTTMTWVTDRAATQDVLHLLTPGPLTGPVWTWPDRPGVAGCTTTPGVVVVAQRLLDQTYVLHTGPQGSFTGDPEGQHKGDFGHLGPITTASDGFIWVGTTNKDGGKPVASDDRVLRLEAPSGGASKS
jgi:glucose/arabinose dehydrogenase